MNKTSESFEGLPSDIPQIFKEVSYTLDNKPSLTAVDLAYSIGKQIQIKKEYISNINRIHNEYKDARKEELNKLLCNYPAALKMDSILGVHSNSNRVDQENLPTQINTYVCPMTNCGKTITKPRRHLDSIHTDLPEEKSTHQNYQRS